MSTKHLHRYVRSKTNKEVYKCVHPDCTHYNLAELIIGKRAECAKCGSEMIIDKKQINARNKNLTCSGCSRSKKAKEHQETKNLIDNIINSIERI